MVTTGIALLHSNTGGGVNCSMNAGAMVQSTGRTARDYFHFALTSLGTILALAGVVIVSWRTAICGLVIIVFGLAFFALED
jgi:hypothetical protein